MITEYAWGTIWTRPGLDRRSRSMITLTALIARGHHEELAMHLRAARRNGLTNDEIKELLMQTAIYCGVPDANTAFRIAVAGAVGLRARRMRRCHDDPDHDRAEQAVAGIADGATDPRRWFRYGRHAYDTDRCVDRPRRHRPDHRE